MLLLFAFPLKISLQFIMPGANSTSNQETDLFRKHLTALPLTIEIIEIYTPPPSNTKPTNQKKTQTSIKPCSIPQFKGKLHTTVHRVRSRIWKSTDLLDLALSTRSVHHLPVQPLLFSPLPIKSSGHTLTQCRNTQELQSWVDTVNDCFVYRW